jgi:hypothetical protein
MPFAVDVMQGGGVHGLVLVGAHCRGSALLEPRRHSGDLLIKHFQFVNRFRNVDHRRMVKVKRRWLLVREPAHEAFRQRGGWYWHDGPILRLVGCGHSFGSAVYTGVDMTVKRVLERFMGSPNSQSVGELLWPESWFEAD